jgi:hypothetical protein
LGFGEIDYGLGSLAADQSPAVDPNELGYFVTVSVLSQIPEPASASLAVIALLVAVWAHGRRKS